MAIQLSLTDDDTGAVYPTAYWRVVGVTFPTSLAGAIVLVAPFADATSAASKNPIGPPRRYAMGPAAFAAIYPANALVAETISRAYAWLKTRAEFVGAVDV